MQPSAKIITDSISPAGHRLTTMEVVMHRFVLAEFNTHRVFSRNSASSRARPLRKTMDEVRWDTAYPVVWTTEQPGMSGGPPLDDPVDAQIEWDLAAQDALRHADNLKNMGVHKSIVNRLLEPFMWHTVIVTATSWNSFWHQRVHPAAQPEMRAAAEVMWIAYINSKPTRVPESGWHLPYIDKQDWDWARHHVSDHGSLEDQLRLLRKISSARCARVSYLTHDGKRDPMEDIRMFEVTLMHRDRPDDPIHASPLEHVARPAPLGAVLGNFIGWQQYRHIETGEMTHNEGHYQTKMTVS